MVVLPQREFSVLRLLCTCVFSVLPHAEFGPNDRRENAPHFNFAGNKYEKPFQSWPNLRLKFYFPLQLLRFLVRQMPDLQFPWWNQYVNLNLVLLHGRVP